MRAGLGDTSEAAPLSIGRSSESESTVDLNVEAVLTYYKAPVLLFCYLRHRLTLLKPSSHFHDLDAESVTVYIRDYSS